MVEPAFSTEMCSVLLSAAWTLFVPQRGRCLKLRPHNRALIVMKMGKASLKLENYGTVAEGGRARA